MLPYRSLRVSALLVASCVAATAQTYYWSSLAGLPPQTGSIDGVGTAARFFSPQGLIATTTNIVYVCDANNYTIRRIAADGAVSTLAGTPGQRGAVDGSAATARFGFPTSITLASGYIYVTDRSNHAIRRVGGNGAVSTFAGRLGISGATDGSGNTARFSGPSAITADAAGNLFVADADNHVIRKITVDGEVTTLAGLAGTSGSADGASSAARFNRPGGLFMSSSGVLYVADTYNHTIRRIAPDGVVTTLAGQAGVAGGVNGTGAAARFRYPRGILAYTNGTVMVVDQTHAVRQISPEGVVTTYAGRLDTQGSRNGDRNDARFYTPVGLTFHSDGFVVGDTNNNSVRKIASATGMVSVLAGSPGNFGQQDGTATDARFNFPQSIAVHSSGDIYVADTRGNTIRRISPAGEVVRIAGSPLGGSASGGDAYVDGPADVQSLNYPMGLAVTEDRTVYFCEQQRHTIRVVRPNGSVETLAGREGVAGSADGAGAAALFGGPSGIALDKQGNVYIADTLNSTIRKIAAGTNVVTTFAGRALVTGSDDGRGTNARFRLPRSLAIDADGNLYVADTSNHTIRKITADGDVTTVAGQEQTQGAANGSGAVARFYFPFALAVDAHGTIFVAETGNELIRRIVGNTVSTIGGTTEVAGFYDGPGVASFFANPSGIAVDARGVVYVADSGNNVIRRGEVMTTPAIATEPRSVGATLGSSATLSVSATGGGLTYQWQRNGSPITGATGSSYTIASVASTDAADYTVTARNTLGSVTSQSATLSITTASEAGRIVNLSILTSIATPGDGFTMGFVVGGNGTAGEKPLVIRAAGPALGALGVAGTLDDPKLDLFQGSAGAGGNDNWGGASTLADAMRRVGAFAYATPDSRDAAFSGLFQSGNNSVQIAASGGGTGKVIAEIYDATSSDAFSATTPRLVNVSVLKHIGSGLTAGFAIGGRSAKNVLIRAIGPSLAPAPFNVAGALADPQIALYAGQTLQASNDNWGGAATLIAAFAQVGAFALDTASRDAALVANLAPGSYTVEVSGVGSTTGVALVEIYELP